MTDRIRAADVIAERYPALDSETKPRFCLSCGERVYIDDAGIARHVVRGGCEVASVSASEAS